VGSTIVARTRPSRKNASRRTRRSTGEENRAKNASSAPVPSGSRSPTWSSSGRIREIPELWNSRWRGRSAARRSATAHRNPIARKKTAETSTRNVGGMRM
jgi:hypothetical protein